MREVRVNEVASRRRKNGGVMKKAGNKGNGGVGGRREERFNEVISFRYNDREIWCDT